MVTKNELEQVLVQVNAIFKQYDERITKLEEALKEKQTRRASTK